MPTASPQYKLVNDAFGKRGELGRVIVTLTGTSTGGGTIGVIFNQTFVSTPGIKVFGTLGDSGGTYSAASASKSGFTVTVSGSDLNNQDIWVWYYAQEL